MTKSDYLKKLRWDESKFMVLTAEECAPLLGVPGAVNQMFKIGEPSAKASFGAGAMVVNIAWANQHLASAPAEEVKPAASTPPPAPSAPPKEVSTPPLPTPPPVPEKLQEIAKESPNVVIASIPKPEAPSNNNVEARIAWLEKAGLTVDREKQTITDDEGEVTEFKDLEGISNEDWMEVTVYYSPKNIRDRREAKETAPAPVEETPIVEEVVEDEPEVDEEAEALAEYEATQKAKEEAAKQPEVPVKQQPKEEDKPEEKVEKETPKQPEPDAKKSEEDKIAKEKAKAEQELTEQTKFRRIALQAIGWKEAKTPGYIIGPKSSLRYQEILDMPEAEFKKLLAEHTAQKEEAPKKTAPEMIKEIVENQKKDQAQLEKEIDEDESRFQKTQLDAHKEEVEAIIRDEAILRENYLKSQEENFGAKLKAAPPVNARELDAKHIVMHLIANGQASRPAKELAKYAYDLVDEIAKLAKK